MRSSLLLLIVLGSSLCGPAPLLADLAFEDVPVKTSDPLPIIATGVALSAGFVTLGWLLTRKSSPTTRWGLLIGGVLLLAGATAAAISWSG